MSVLAECLICHKKQSVNNKLCLCGEDLVKAKRSKRVRYWITYRLPGGKQRRESVGFSIEEARDAFGKRRSQKRENRIFDIKPDAKMTFNELTKWYLESEKLKAMAYYPTLTINLNSFNEEFGNMIVNQIKPMDLENYQAKKKAVGYADCYIDHQIGAARSMINKAFDNNIVGGDTLRVFKKIKKLLKKNANARDKILPLDQLRSLLAHLPSYSKPIIATGFYSGMRRGEILGLTWDKVDLKQRVISLEATDTKDKEPRKVPISEPLYEVLSGIPRAIHDNHVFLYRGAPIKEIRKSLETACNKAGIIYGRFQKDGFIFHDLRHTFNTYLRKAGVAESVIMEITGHSTREMFDRYNTIDGEDTRKAVELMQSFLQSVDHSVDQEINKEVANSLTT